jgi:hypothetical protein
MSGAVDAVFAITLLVRRYFVACFAGSLKTEALTDFLFNATNMTIMDFNTTHLPFSIFWLKSPGPSASLALPKRFSAAKLRYTLYNSFEQSIKRQQSKTELS